MNAMGWQIGATLVGVSSLIVAIYIAKLLNTTTKVVEKANRLVDYNERYINETIENITFISKDTREIISIVSNVSNILKVFKVFRK